MDQEKLAEPVEKSDSAADGAAPKTNRWNLIKDVTVPLIVATVALLGTYLGSYLTQHASREIQAVQVSEERTKADRERRAEVYLKFLASADSYGNKMTARILECFRGGPSNPARPAEQEEQILQCYRDFHRDVPDVSQAFNDALDRVYIFGSDEASIAASNVAQALPDVRALHTISGRYEYSFKGRVFSDSYKEFRRVACREIPAKPRSNC